VPNTQWINLFRKKLVNDYWGKLGYLPTKVYEWCDGAGCQFKCAEAFADVSDSKTELGYDVIRYFFETSHAKGDIPKYAVTLLTPMKNMLKC
jgi:hypothetical protein